MNQHRYTNILLRYNQIHIPLGNGKPISQEALATILMNFSYYGKALSNEAYQRLVNLSGDELAHWWQVVETELKVITGASRKIGDFVVYKNFPQEVLDKSAADYWIPQILMYWGFPKEIFTDPVLPREKMAEQPKCVALKFAKENSLSDILTSLCKSPARWKEEELSDALFLSQNLPVDLAKMGFKENMVLLATRMMEHGIDIKLSSATDVLRLAAGLSDGDVSLRTKFRFKSFKKPVRRFLLRTMEKCGSLKEDMARRPELWKRLIHQLHPGDWHRQFPLVCKAMNELYKDRLETFNSQVEQLLSKKDAKVLEVLSSRPGEFRRRLFHTLNLFGKKATTAFTKPEVLDKLTTYQLVSLRTLLENNELREHRTFPPKGNWGKMQLGTPRVLPAVQVTALSKALGKTIAKRLPKVNLLDEETKMVKLPSNGEAGPYARGTVFPIPEKTDFIRTASYWKVNQQDYTWFDNGWNFFSDDWKPLGACCWSNPKFPGSRWDHKPNDKKVGAVFSGDPTIATGQACQMIDLYPNQLREAGVRYAVWGILCYSGLKFSEAEDVFAAFQWGENANTGKLFEPARCQLAIPLTGDQLTKYVCLIDLDKMEMVYLDAGLKSSVSSAERNGPLLSRNLPPFIEYINSLPSVHDLFRDSVDDDSSTYVLYSDNGLGFKETETSYVFRPVSKENRSKSLDLNSLLTK